MTANIIKYNWQADSLCKKELKFIPETGEHVPYTADDFYLPIGKAVSPEVKDMCERCPVKKECLEHALQYEKYGYWAGTSEKQRIAIRRKRGISYRAPQSFSWIDPWEHLKKTLNTKENKQYGNYCSTVKTIYGS